MVTFVNRNWVSLARIGAGVILVLALLVLVMMFAPSFAPGNHTMVAPIAVFGLISMAAGMGASRTSYDERSHRFLAIGVVTFGAFVVGCVVGSQGLREVAYPDHTTYGLFLGSVCAGMALATAGIAFVFPRFGTCEKLAMDWRIRRSYARRY